MHWYIDYGAVHPGIVGRGGHCQSLLPLTNSTRQLPLVQANLGLFGWSKSRLISADLIVPCEKK